MDELEAPQRRWTLRRSLRAATTVGAGLLVWLALVAPNDARDLSFAGLLRVPAELPVIALAAVLLTPRARRSAAILVGVALALVAMLKMLDIGFRAVFDRPFDALNDWYYLRPGLGVLGDQVGRPAALAVAMAAAVLVAAFVFVMPLALLRLTALAARHRAGSLRIAGALVVVWSLGAVSGLQASPSASGVVYDQVSRVRADLKDRQTFAKEIAVDPLRDSPDQQMLTGLRGKDVLLVFVESYGRVAVQGSAFSPRIAALLDGGTNRLAKAGFSSKSAFLTSPTFGAGSWLAHSSLQSGLWVDSQQRYNQLVTGERRTLTGIFGRAGQHQGLVGGIAVLRLRPALRRKERRLPRTEVRLCVNAGPIHPLGVPAPRAGKDRSPQCHGRDRSCLKPSPLGTATHTGGLGRRW